MIFISPPFGNYITHEDAISIAGSYTINPRPGVIIQTLKTLRPIKGGWVNKIGLRNCGIKNVDFDDKKVYSLAALKRDDWIEFLDIVPETVYGVELNISCPNQESVAIEGILGEYTQKYSFVSIKLPPDKFSEYYIDFGLRHGVTCFHFCNTLSVACGGESGERLKKYSISMIESIRRYFGSDFEIIGGGGIYSQEDIEDYKKAGANHFSIATVWFNPLKALNLLKDKEKVDKGK